MPPDLSNAEISVEGEFHTCEACGLDSRDEFLFTIHGWGTQCAPGFGCNTDEPDPIRRAGLARMRALPERDPDEAYDDAIDAALERGGR